MSIGPTLAALNAALNATSALLLLAGRRHIRAGRQTLHSRRMLTALTVSSMFLASYLTRLALAGTTRFHGVPWLRTAYLLLLLTHTIAAVSVVPLILRTVFLALKERFEDHRRLARWTYPTWLYVSVTGVLVYVMLYHVGAPSSANGAGAQTTVETASRRR